MRQKKGIEYAEDVINAYSGCLNIENKLCSVGKHCWAFGMAHRMKGRFGYDEDEPFKPTFHADRLDKPLNIKKPTRFACCFMGDIAYCKKEWFKEILNVIRKCPQHTFIFLTKVPSRLEGIEFPDNCWVGVTVNNNSDLHRIEKLRGMKARVKFISFEPLEEDIDCELDRIDWIIIGAKTGRKPFQPSNDWVIKLIVQAKMMGIPVFLKPNLDEFQMKDGLIKMQELPYEHEEDCD